MASPDLQDDLKARGRYDGRAAFGLGAFAFATVLLILLDRVGAPERLVASLGPIAVLCGLAVIGVAARGLRISTFYAGGRTMPSAYAGLALAALAAGLAAPFAPPDFGGLEPLDLLLGMAFGLATVAFATGPLVRKTGAFSVTDLVLARFPDLALRIGVVAVVCVVSFFVAGAALESAVRGLQTALQMHRSGAVAFACAVILLICAPAGVSGVVWASFAAGCALLVGLGLPVALTVAQGGASHFPGFGASDWAQALALTHAWRGGAGAEVHPVFVLAVAAGVASLCVLFAPAISTCNRRCAHQAGRTALGWLLVLFALGLFTIAASALALEAATAGHRPDQIAGAIYQASSHGLVVFCGKSADQAADALAACGRRPGFAGVLGPQDASARGSYLLTALPELKGFGEAYAGLAAAGAIAVSLALASAAFLALATAIGHDAIYRLRATGALTSRRLAITRGVLVLAVIGAGFALLRRSVHVQEMLGLATAFSAASIAPLLVLTFWPRASGAEALFALLCGLGAAEAFIVASGGPPTLARLCEGAALAFAVALAVGVASSLLRAPDPLRGGSVFFDRVVHGYGDVLNPDKGA